MVHAAVLLCCVRLVVVPVFDLCGMSVAKYMRHVTVQLGQHVQGLSIAVRALQSRGRLSNRVSKNLAQLDSRLDEAEQCRASPNVHGRACIRA